MTELSGIWNSLQLVFFFIIKINKKLYIYIVFLSIPKIRIHDITHL